MRVRLAVPIALLALALAAGTARAEIKTQWIDYRQGDTPLRGYLAYDDAITGPRPGVLLVHRRDGMSALTLKNAEMVARLGYVVFAPDIFGVVPKETKEEVEQSTKFNNDRPLMRARAQAGFDAAHDDAVVQGAEFGFGHGYLVAADAA